MPAKIRPVRVTRTLLTFVHKITSFCAFTYFFAQISLAKNLIMVMHQIGLTYIVVSDKVVRYLGYYLS